MADKRIIDLEEAAQVTANDYLMIDSFDDGSRKLKASSLRSGVATTEDAGVVKPDGTTVTVDQDGTIHSAAAAPIATSDTAGIVKPDGSTITVDQDGTLHGADATPTATTSVAGKVKPDGTTITITQDGTITAHAEGGVQTETDPTVPAWAKQPTKPTYTAQEVGALPSSTAIPSKTSDLTNDSRYAAVDTASTQPFYIDDNGYLKARLHDTLSIVDGRIAVDYGPSLYLDSGQLTQGESVTATGDYAHAEGSKTRATGQYSHAEGRKTEASGSCAHAEGVDTVASGAWSHAQGKNTEAKGASSTAAGEYTTAEGRTAEAHGYATEAHSDLGNGVNKPQFVIGAYNVVDATEVNGEMVPNGTYAFIIGNGTSDSNRSNLMAVGWDGKIYMNGVNILADLERRVRALEGSSVTAEVSQGVLSLSGSGVNVTDGILEIDDPNVRVSPTGNLEF